MKMTLKNSALAILVSLGVTGCGSSSHWFQSHSSNEKDSSTKLVGNKKIVKETEAAKKAKEQAEAAKKAKEAAQKAKEEAEAAKKAQEAAKTAKEKAEAAKKAEEAAKKAKEQAEAAKKAEEAAKKAKEQAEAAKKAEEAAKKAKEQAEAAKKAEEAAKKAKEQAEAAKKAEETAKKAEAAAVASLQYNLSQEAKKGANLEVIYGTETPQKALKKEVDGKYRLSEVYYDNRNGDYGDVVTFDNDGYSNNNVYMVGDDVARTHSFSSVKGNALSYSQTMFFDQSYYDDDSARVEVGAYIGKATSAKDLDKLSGSAKYVGKATLKRHHPTENVNKRYQGDVNGNNIIMNVNFDKKVMSGEIPQIGDKSITGGYRTAMVFKDANIKQENDEITFTGKAQIVSRDPNVENKLLDTIKEGDYKGKFMGPNVAELAGSAEFKNTKRIENTTDFSKVYTIFNAAKLPKTLKQQKEFTYTQEDGRKITVTPIYIDNDKDLAALFKKEADGKLKLSKSLPSLVVGNDNDIKQREDIFSGHYSEIFSIKDYRDNRSLSHNGMLAYAGIPTSSKDITNLAGKGELIYNGKAIISKDSLIDSHHLLDLDKNYQDVFLYVDFDKKSIDGKIKESTDNREERILLSKGVIKEKDGNIAFSGKATYLKDTRNSNIPKLLEGDYEGKFMGPNAVELAGKAEFKVPEDKIVSQDLIRTDNFFDSTYDIHTKVSAAFNARQIKQ